MKAADQLWIVFRHYHGGYDATPSNENGYDLLTSGYASASASYVDMLIIAMGRLLPAIDMDMLLPELPMVDMLLSAMDMSLPEPPRWICSPQPWVWICSF